MQLVLPENKENGTRKTDGTVKTEETEERRRKCEETMMFEDKRDNAFLTYACKIKNISMNS